MRLKEGCSGLWIAAVVAVCDRLSKAIVLQMPYDTAPLWPGVLGLRRTANTGMAFSLLSGHGLLLTLVTAALIAGLTAWLIVRPQAQTRMMRIGLWMVAGGGLGNLYDRIFYGHVIDFIEPLFVRFAVFNLADAAICTGVALTAVGIVADEWKKERTHGGNSTGADL